MPTNKMNAFFNFPMALTATPPKGLSYNNLQGYLTEAIDGINGKYKIVKNSKSGLQKMVEEGNLSEADLKEVLDAREKISGKSIELYGLILAKEDYTPEMKADLLKKINTIRITMSMYILKDDGTIEKDKDANQKFFDSLAT